MKALRRSLKQISAIASSVVFEQYKRWIGIDAIVPKDQEVRENFPVSFLGRMLKYLKNDKIPN